MEKKVDVFEYGVGTRGDNHHAWFTSPDLGGWEGPARLTEAEAMKDRDEIISRHKILLGSRVLSQNTRYGTTQ